MKNTDLLLFGLVAMLASPVTSNQETGTADLTTSLETLASMEQQLEVDPDNIELLTLTGSLFYTLGAKGDPKAVGKSCLYIMRALELAPGDPELLSLYGGIQILRGRDAEIPFDKMKHVQKGLAGMDQAVHLAPDDIGIRMNRAIYCLNLPDFFARIDTTLQDYHHLLAQDETRSNYLTPKTKAEILLNMGHAYCKIDDKNKALGVLRLAIAVAPGTPSSREASELLEKLMESRSLASD